MWHPFPVQCDTEQFDAEFEKYRGYLLNQKMVEALMTEEVAKEAP